MIPNKLKRDEFKFTLLKAKEKIPIIPNWPDNGLAFNSTDLKKHIEAGGNVGVICGIGKLIIIDFDLKAFQDKYLPMFPDTFTVRSGGGLLHLYFKTDNPENLKLLNKEKETLADVQAKRKQIVIPPSIHPNGTAYLIEKDIDITFISMAEVKAIFSDYISIEQSSRVSEGIIDKPELVTVLSMYGINTSQNPTKCLWHSSKGGKCFSFDNMKGLWYCFHCEKGGDVISFVENADGVDFKTACEKINIKLSEKKQVSKEVFASEAHLEKLNTVINLKTLLKEGIPPQEWRVEKLIPKRGITIFGGTSGSFKTFTAMHLAVCVSTGASFLDFYETNPCSVLYIDEENGCITIPNRFAALKKGAEIDFDIENLWISIFNDVVLDYEGGATLLELMIRKFEPKLVILDSMVRLMRGEEDKAADVKRVFENLKPFLDMDISFVILHHTTKKDQMSMAGLRGSGDFAAFSDCLVMFNGGKKGYCNVSIVKNRHIELDESAEFFFQVVNDADDKIRLVYRGQKDEKGNVIERAAEEILTWIQHENIKSFHTEKVSLLLKSKGHSKSTIFAALSRMKDNREVTKLKRGSYLVNEDMISTVEEEKV